MKSEDQYKLYTNMERGGLFQCEHLHINVFNFEKHVDKLLRKTTRYLVSFIKIQYFAANF